jgi:hypothetical protein
LRLARSILKSVAQRNLDFDQSGRLRRLSTLDCRDHDAAMMSSASRLSRRLPQVTL